MSKPSSSALLLRPVSWASLAAASAALISSVVLIFPADAQVLGGYGQHPNGPIPSRSAQPMPSWASPQPMPTWASPQPMPVWATPQTPSWAQAPSPSYRRQSPGITPVPVTSAPIFMNPSEPSSSITNQPPQDRPGSPGVEYRRRNVQPNTGSRSDYPLNGSVALGTVEPVRRSGSIVPSSNAPRYGSSQPSYQITETISAGQRRHPARDYNNYIYNAPIEVVGGPTLLGGYYYGNYCAVPSNANCYPSVYGAYDGFPQYIYNPGVVIVSEPYYPVYITTYLPFYVPDYQVTYNENNYYVGSEDRVQQIQQGGAPAQEALKNAYPADSFQAAFADIQKAWLNNDPALIDKHLRDTDTKLSVFVSSKYSYSLASGDFLKITRDAFDRLNTISFDFTRLRKAKNGDVTAFGKHVYRSSGESDSGTDKASVSDTVPFSTDGSQPYDKSDDPASGVDKTIYVSYTLRHHDSLWYIIAVDSSPKDLVDDSNATPAAKS